MISINIFVKFSQGIHTTGRLNLLTFIVDLFEKPFVFHFFLLGAELKHN